MALKKRAVKIPSLTGGDERKYTGVQLRTRSTTHADYVGDIRRIEAGSERPNLRRHAPQPIDMEPPPEGKAFFVKVDGIEGVVRRVEAPDGPIAVFYPGSKKDRKPRD